MPCACVSLCTRHNSKSMSPDDIRRVLEFYQDLGIKSIYRRGNQLAAATAAAPESILTFDDLPRLPPRTPSAVPAPRPASAPPSSSMIDIIPLAPENDTLERIRTDIGECKRCRLCE